MKVAICLIAFVVGCFVTVFLSGESNKAKIEKNNAEVAPEIAETPAPQDTEMKTEIQSSEYGTTADGRAVTKFVCTNKNGIVVELIDYGATVIAVKTPDKDGKIDNIILSCNDMAGYEACGSYFGSTVGRYCNRIANGKFTIDGNQYTLNTNNGDNHLHGGNVGFDKKIWKATKIENENSVGVRFELTSKDGDEGYPGTLKVVAEYILNNEDELIVDFKATTDKKTHVNLTNHNYWNLDGAGSGTIEGHQLRIEADNYLPVVDGIPTGELKPSKDTAFDFSDFKKMGAQLKETSGEPLGYDHCYALRNQQGKLTTAAIVRAETSGRVLEIHTTQPGLQFYTGNFLDGQPGSGGFDQYHAFCLETQHYPDSPNQPDFPSTLLVPGETYHQKTVHKFRVEK